MKPIVKITPCDPPPLWELDNVDTSKPYYVPYGHITIDKNGHQTGEIRWEKHEVVVPVI
jgi:hypothetical protein